MAERAYELLELKTNQEDEKCEGFLLDIGCGSGLSGNVLTENGHLWVGMDISAEMLSNFFLR